MPEVIKSDSTYVKAYFKIGYCYEVLNQYKKSIEFFEKAIKIDPELPIAHFTLGVAYYFTGNKKGTMKEYNILKKT